jgi:N-formylglutamate amidohydrolase
MFMKKVFGTIMALCLLGLSTNAQTFIPGNSYFGKDKYIQYIAGNTPIILSAPHGGYLVPSAFPDRNCDGCSYVSDAYTQELVNEIQQKFFLKTGCYPHLIINLLHRKKLDMNRDLVMATDSNTALDDYWADYHQFIDSAKAKVNRDYNKGLFIDVHGHGHVKQRIEFGYLVSKSTLLLPDSMINLPKYTNYTAIRSLAKSNLKNLSHSLLLRGDYSLGTMFENKGFPGVPSKLDPFPLAADDYFNGGYNTERHGSNTLGKIDAIQMELYSAIRFDSVQRKKFADSFVSVMIDYLGAHYFVNYGKSPCTLSNIEEENQRQKAIHFYPNPAKDHILLSNDEGLESYSLFNLQGQLIKNETKYKGNKAISLENVPSGWILIRFVVKGNILWERLIKE